MKRIFKLLFSRLTIVGLTIILMFVVDALIFLGVFYFAEEALIATFGDASVWIRVAFGFVQFLIVFSAVLHIVNRDMIPETKIPWLLCVLLLNLFGVAIYIVFSYNRPSRRHRRRYEKLNARSRPFLRGEEIGEMGEWGGVSRALSASNPNAVLYGNTSTEYFPRGEVFFERYLEDLRGAKEFIFLEYFIIARGKMWDTILGILAEKVKEGVEVRVSYDDIGCMGKVRAGYWKKLRKMGIKCVKFSPFVPVVSNVHNNRDHRKITVIDGRIGYTGGLNLADEYINAAHPYGDWKDTAVRLEGEGVVGLTLMFLRLFNLRSKEPEDFSPYIPTDFAPRAESGYVQPFGDGPRPLYGAQIAEEVYLNILGMAKRYVYIMTPYLIPDQRLETALTSAARRGADVRLILPHIPDKKIPFALARSCYKKLMAAGVKIYEYTPGFVHAKMFLADDEAGVIGTVNLDYRSLLHHYENAVFMYRTEALSRMKEDFMQTFADSRLMTEEDAKKRVVIRLVCEIAKVFAPLF